MSFLTGEYEYHGSRLLLHIITSGGLLPWSMVTDASGLPQQQSVALLTQMSGDGLVLFNREDGVRLGAAGRALVDRLAASLGPSHPRESESGPCA